MATAAPPRRRERAAPAPRVQAPFAKRRRRVSMSAETREAAVLFAVAYAVYAVIGYRAVVVDHVVPFDSLARLAHAYFVWYNAPPKLAAVGFIWPPVSTLVFLPLAAIKPLAVSFAALPLTTAAFAAGLLVALNGVLRLCEVRRPVRLAIVVAFGANPMILFYAANGMSEAISLFFLTVGVYQFLRWFLTREPRFLLIASVAFALGVLSRYEVAAWAAAASVVVAAALIRQRVVRDELEATLVAYLVPISYGIGVWLFANWLIVGSPFHFLGGQSPEKAATAASAGGTSVATGIVGAFGHVLDVNMRLFPPTLFVLVALLVVFFVRKDLMALSLAGFLAINGVFTALLVARTDVLGFLQLRYNMRAMPLAVVGAAWVHLAARGNRTLRTGILAATLGLLVISLPFTWQAMKTYPYQFEESAFARALETGDSQEGTKSVGGYRVGFGAEKEMADYIHTHVSGRDAILTDDAIAFPVMLLDGRPGVYLDRIDAGDAFWLDIANAPWGRVRYVLVAPIVHEDLVLVRYPELAHGSYGAFRLVHRNAGWALYSVAEQR